MQKLHDYADGSLTDLRDQLSTLKEEVNQAINLRKRDIETSTSLSDNEKRMLNNFIPAAQETINYISDLANSWINIGENQNITATNESIEAYELILRIAKNPNTPIKENEIAILQGLERHKLFSIISVALAILTFSLLILSALILMSLKAIAITSFTLSAALPIIACVFLISAVSSYYNSDAYSQDKNLQANLTQSLPAFFGKQPPKDKEKDSDILFQDPSTKDKSQPQ